MPVYKLKENITLENGESLITPQIQYHSYGKINKDGSNVIWVCHALTGNSDVLDWWPSLFGDESHYNPQDYFIICANILGSHYDTTGPLSIDPLTDKPYYHSFPKITIRDMVAMHIKLADHLNIKKIHLLIGGSMGGHQALEWSIIEPSRINNLCLLASSAVISPWAAAFNQTQRTAIENDSSWLLESADAGKKGLSNARAIALLSYRNQMIYNETQKELSDERIYSSKAASYQNYQGQKLVKRFNAFSYWHLAKAMDSHNVGRGRESVNAALSQVKASTLIISVEGDLLFPQPDQLELKHGIIDSKHVIIDSQYGHDGFLIEGKKIEKKLMNFFELALKQVG